MPFLFYFKFYTIFSVPPSFHKSPLLNPADDVGNDDIFILPFDLIVMCAVDEPPAANLIAPLEKSFKIAMSPAVALYKYADDEVNILYAVVDVEYLPTANEPAAKFGIKIKLASAAVPFVAFVIVMLVAEF